VRSCSDQVEVVAVDFVEQEPIGFDVAVAMVLPVAAQWVIFVVQGQGVALNQEQNQLAQLRHVLSPPLSQFDIAPELRTTDWVAHA